MQRTTINDLEPQLSLSEKIKEMLKATMKQDIGDIRYSYTRKILTENIVINISSKDKGKWRLFEKIKDDLTDLDVINDIDNILKEKDALERKRDNACKERSDALIERDILIKEDNYLLKQREAAKHNAEKSIITDLEKEIAINTLSVIDSKKNAINKKKEELRSKIYYSNRDIATFQEKLNIITKVRDEILDSGAYILEAFLGKRKDNPSTFSFASLSQSKKSSKEKSLVPLNSKQPGLLDSKQLDLGQVSINLGQLSIDLKQIEISIYQRGVKNITEHTTDPYLSKIFKEIRACAEKEVEEDESDNTEKEGEEDESDNLEEEVEENESDNTEKEKESDSKILKTKQYLTWEIVNQILHMLNNEKTLNAADKQALNAINKIFEEINGAIDEKYVSMAKHCKNMLFCEMINEFIFSRKIDSAEKKIEQLRDEMLKISQNKLSDNQSLGSILLGLKEAQDDIKNRSWGSILLKLKEINEKIKETEDILKNQKTMEDIDRITLDTIYNIFNKINEAAAEYNSAKIQLDTAELELKLVLVKKEVAESKIENILTKVTITNNKTHSESLIFEKIKSNLNDQTAINYIDDILKKEKEVLSEKHDLISIKNNAKIKKDSLLLRKHSISKELVIYTLKLFKFSKSYIKEISDNVDNNVENEIYKIGADEIDSNEIDKIEAGEIDKIIDDIDESKEEIDRIKEKVDDINREMRIICSRMLKIKTNLNNIQISKNEILKKYPQSEEIYDELAHQEDLMIKKTEDELVGTTNLDILAIKALENKEIDTAGLKEALFD